MTTPLSRVSLVALLLLTIVLVRPMPTIAEVGETSEASADARIVDSGQLGTCVWTLDDQGEVVISPQDGVSGTLPAGPLPIPDTATSVRFEETVRPDGYVGAQYLFSGKSSLISVDVTGLDTSGTTNFYGVFSGCSSLETIEGLDTLDTRSAETMTSMFSGCQSLTSLDVSSFDTGNVTNMSSMFNLCQSLESLDVSGFDTADVTSMGYMFYDCGQLTALNVAGFDTGSVTDMGCMFGGCVGLTSLDVSRFDTADVTDMSSMFGACQSLTALDVSSFDTGNVTNMYGMFDSCNSLTSLNVSDFDTADVTNMSMMFSSCESLTDLDVSGFATGSVTDMSSMFSGCSSIRALKVSEFDTGDVTDMSAMFNSCSSLEGLDLSGFKTENVTDMSWMFGNCWSLESLNISGLNTTNAADMSYMFYGCSSLPVLDVSRLDTTNTTDMSWMFGNCYSLESLNVSGFETSGVTTMVGMFSGCDALRTLDVSGFDTSAVTDMSLMFWLSGLKSLDLSSFDTSAVVEGISPSTGFSTGAVFVSPTIETVTVGEGYTLPFPEASTGWWVSSDGTVYENPADVPSGVADTYSVYRKVAVPSATEGLDYTGGELVGVPEGEGYVLSGTWKATEIGDYEAVATLEDGFVWADGTTDPVTISWSIAAVVDPVDPDEPDEPGGSGGQVIPTPPSGGDLVFTGEDQVGVPQGEGYVVSGTWHATDPGTYEAIVTPEEGYTWEDGTDDPVVIEWSIVDDEEAGSEDAGDEAHGHWLPSWFWRLLPWILAVVGVAAVAWLFALVVRARPGHGRHWRR